MHSVASTVMVASYIIQEASTVANSITEPIFFLVSAIEEDPDPCHGSFESFPAGEILARILWSERGRLDQHICLP